MNSALRRRTARVWMDRAWFGWLALLLTFLFLLYRSGYVCSFFATDFRGYYASAQIAWQHGFAEVYNQSLQDSYQAKLPLRCPDGSYAPPPLRVSMPYLPAFVVLLLPMPAIEFTTGYTAWTILNLAVLLLYCGRFCRVLGGSVSWMKVAQWALCLPLLATLSLGQMNVFLVICLGEIALSLSRGKALPAGAWLVGLLIKPHALVLLLPGLVLARQWKVLAGFTFGSDCILVVSYLLAGAEGLRAMLGMVGQFASPSFETAPTMMNWRSLAMNLQGHTANWLAWGLASAGTLVLALLAVSLWRFLQEPAGRWVTSHGSRLEYLITATYAATCSVAWHSHFYMLLPLVPFLALLDSQNRVPALYLFLWVWSPPLLYLLFYALQPDMARSGLGLGMLALNLALFAWLRGVLLQKISPGTGKQVLATPG